MITPLFLHLEIAGICSEAVLLYFFHHQCQQIRVWLQVYNMNLHWTAWNYVTQSRCLDRNNQWTTKLCHFYTYVCASVFSIHITDKHTYILIVTFLNIDDHFDLLRYIYIYICWDWYTDPILKHRNFTTAAPLLFFSIFFILLSSPLGPKLAGRKSPGALGFMKQGEGHEWSATGIETLKFKLKVFQLKQKSLFTVMG